MFLHHVNDLSLRDFCLDSRLKCRSHLQVVAPGLEVGSLVDSISFGPSSQNFAGTNEKFQFILSPIITYYIYLLIIIFHDIDTYMTTLRAIAIAVLRCVNSARRLRRLKRKMPSAKPSAECRFSSHLGVSIEAILPWLAFVQYTKT